MTSDTDDAHCDSLSGATVATHALSMPPSLRPAPPRRAFALAACLVASAVVGAGWLAAGTWRVPTIAAPEALRVEGAR